MPVREAAVMDARANERTNERTVWMNGEFMPDSQALVLFRDRSFF